MPDKRLDELVQHRIGLERYQTSILRQVIPVLQEAEQDLVQIINEKLFDPRLSLSEARRLETTLRTVRKTLLEAYEVIFKRLWSEYRGLSAHEADWAHSYYRDLFAVQHSISVPSASTIVAAALERPMSGRHLKAWADKMTAEQIAEVERQIRLGVIEGESIDQMVRRIRGTEAYRYRDGWGARQRRSLEALVRTSVNHISNAAHLSFLQQNPEVFQKVQFVAVLDNRTTPRCRSLSGQIFDIDKAPVPPLHPNCRSTIVGLPTAPDGTLATEPLTDVSYDEWLREQPVAVQEDVLGIAKAKLFRIGELKIDRFVDHTGKELTLDQLRRKEREAWERTFLTADERRAMSVTRRINSLVSQASDEMRPFAETAQRAWQFLRFHSSQWLEAVATQWSRPVDPELVWLVFMLDFFDGPVTVQLFRSSAFWRSIIRRAIRPRPALVYPHARMPRGLIVHPTVRQVRGEILPPPGRSRAPVPVGPRPRPGDGVIIDIDPTKPPPPPPRRPIVPPRQPGSIIIPPDRRPPPTRRPPPDAPTPPPRTPVPTERLPHVMRVIPDKDGEAIIPKIADDVKSLPPSSPVRMLPTPQPGQVPAKVHALTNNLPVPKNPRRITVPDLERELDRLLPAEGARFNADDALRALWDAFKKSGHDGLEILDNEGKPRLRIGINENVLTEFLDRWRAARAAFDSAQRPALPAPPPRAALPSPARIADRPAVRPGARPAEVIELPQRPPPAPIPPHGVPGDLAAVAKTQLGNATRAIEDLAKPKARRRFPLQARIDARRAREAEVRRILAEQQIRDLLADLNEINAGLEGLRPISRQHQARADMLQRLINQNKLETDVTVYRPVRWANYADRLGASPARLDKVVIESPSFISGTGDEVFAFEAGSRFGNGPLVVMRMNLRAGDAAIAGNREAHELVLPAGTRLKVNAVARMRAADIPADLRKLYPQNQEFWLADTELVRPGDAVDRAIIAARAEQERYLDRLARMQLDNEAERAMRHTPYTPFRHVSEGADEWPVYNAETGEMLVGPPKAHPVIILGGERRVIDPRDASSAPLYRRALGTMINRSGRVQPLTDEIAKEAQEIGDRFIKGFSLERLVRRWDAKDITRAHRFLPESREDIVRKVRELIDVDMEQFGDVAAPLGYAILKKDPVAFARMASQLSNANMRGYFFDRGYDATRAAQEGAELQRGARLFAELVDGITKGRARVKFYDLSDLDGTLRKYRGKEHLAQAFEAWFALEYSPNPTWRRIMDHMMPDLDPVMRKVLQARAREPFPDVWAPTLKVTQNRRIVADPRAIDIDSFAIEAPPPSIAAGIRESVRQRFYDYLEGNGSLAKRVHNQIAKDLGISRQDVEVLIREAQRAGWVRAQGRGFRVVPASKRPPRPVGEPAISPTQHQRDQFYDYLEGKVGGNEKSLGSLSQGALRDLQREIGATPLQMRRLTFEAQELGWLKRDTRGQLRRTWTRGLQRTDKSPPPRPKPQDIERIEGTLGTPAARIDPAEAPRRRRGDDGESGGTGGTGAGPVGQGSQTGGLPGQGGLRGSAGELDENVWSSVEDPPLRGLPTEVSVPGRGKLKFGPLKRARQAAIEYMRDAGLPYNPPKTYVKVDPARARRIAEAFEAMPHNPHDPEVKAAFQAMIDETLAQYQYIKKTGLKVDLMEPGQPDPYEASPRLAHLDVIENNHLWVYPTDSGFGSNADFDVSENPLMQWTDEYLNGRRLRANDVFRIVHDYFGHFKEGVGFRADGEENAWRIHSSMYSPLARRAMTTETRGQNSWVNFGPYGEKNRTAKADETIFADQKTGLLPQWIVEEGAGDPPEATLPPVATRRLMQPAEVKEMVERIVSEMKGVPLDKIAYERLPIRTESEEAMVKDVWRHATLTPDIEKAISGAESITISDPTDGPTYYDPVTGTLEVGRRDPASLKDRVWFRHEYGHHLDMPMTPDGTVVQYSAAPEFGLAKAMQADLVRLAETYVPNAKLTMSAEEALAQFKSIYGIDLSSISHPELAHRMAEYALTNNAAFLKVVDQVVRRGVITDAKLTSEFMVYSDLTAAATKLKLGTGHPEAYFAGGFDIGEGYTSRHANEAFANWFALHTSDETGWRVLMQQYFPRLVETNEAILDRIGADAHGEQ